MELKSNFSSHNDEKEPNFESNININVNITVSQNNRVGREKNSSNSSSINKGQMKLKNNPPAKKNNLNENLDKTKKKIVPKKLSNNINGGEVKNKQININKPKSFSQSQTHKNNFHSTNIVKPQNNNNETNKKEEGFL